jgi:hypothetical protein
MSYIASGDQRFLATLEDWLRSQPEILVLIRYSHAAGSKDFEFFTSFDTLLNRIRQLPSLTSIVAFRQRQLPLRGIVDDSFITSCMTHVPNGSEYLVVEATRRTYGRESWFHWEAGDSHDELRLELEGLRGCLVAAGLYPPWLQDTDDVISAVVPDEQGVARAGIY